MKKIIYSAADENMGDTSPEDCEIFREWAQEKIMEEFPDHFVVVSAESGKENFTDDEENRDEILNFLGELWAECPFDWVNQQKSKNNMRTKEVKKELVFSICSCDLPGISKNEKEKFTSWAREQLKNKYPDHKTYVDYYDVGGGGLWTDDKENSADIKLFCNQLWKSFGSDQTREKHYNFYGEDIFLPKL